MTNTRGGEKGGNRAASKWSNESKVGKPSNGGSGSLHYNRGGRFEEVGCAKDQIRYSQG